MVRERCGSACNTAHYVEDLLDFYKTIAICNLVFTCFNMCWTFTASIKPKMNPIHHFKPAYILPDLMLIPFEIAEFILVVTKEDVFKKYTCLWWCFPEKV